jgi:hypothetical protein
MGSLATAAGKGYLGVPTFDDDEGRHRRQLAIVVNNLLAGKMNNTGTLTITANAATTTLTDSRIGANSVILLMPTTANAAAALANVYFTAFGDGSCTVNHANNAQVDRTFRFAVIG